jgi:hypothetical protein
MAKRGASPFNSRLAQHHAEKAYERDKRRGWRSHLDKATGDANDETHDEGDEIADHDSLLAGCRKTHFRRSSIPFWTLLDSVAFTICTWREALFQHPASPAVAAMRPVAPAAGLR